MTLALYGKSRRRKGVLVLLALFVIMAATIGGAALRPSEGAKAASTSLDPTSATCSNSGSTDDDDGATTGWNCTEGATASQLSDVGSGSNSSTGRVNLERDDTGSVRTDILDVTFTVSSLSGTINAASFNVWSAASDSPGVLYLGSTSSDTRYSSFAPGGAPQNYADTDIKADLQSAVDNSDTTFTVRLRLDCDPNADDCGALIDRVQLVVDYSPAGPDLRVNKVARVGGNPVASVTLPNAAFDWVVTLSNQGTATATFANNTVILSDDLPTSGATYSVSESASNFGCSITDSFLTCTASGGTKAIGQGASIAVTVTVTPTGAGTLSNPRSGGTCSVDPSGLVAETDETNNACSTSSVTVNAGAPTDVTATKAASANPVNQGGNFNWVVTIAATGANASWGNNALVLTDQLPTTGATYGSPTDNAGSSLGCSIDGSTKVLTCNAGGSGLTINSGNTVVVTIPVTATDVGSLQNPKSGGTCSVAPATGETNTANNGCTTSTVTVNAASNTDLCAAKNVSACVALLHDFNIAQVNPANSCSGIDANFVIDRSYSISASELAALKGGVTSFASALSGGSKFAGTQFSTTSEAITSGYVSAATFNTAVNGIATQVLTWTEGGIQVGAANNANGTINPDMMFIVTDGSPNQIDGSGNADTTNILTWVNAANDAIDAANTARAAYIIRAVFAGTADDNIPLNSTADKQTFANAVLTRIGGGSFLQGDWTQIADNLLESAGCDPTVNKAAGVPSNLQGNGKYTTVDWSITLTNPATTQKVVTVTDAGATFLSATPNGACTLTTAGFPAAVVGGSGPWQCTIPAKANNQNGLVTLNVRTTVLDYNVCTGTSGQNTVSVTGGATGQSTAPFTIAANPSDPSCLGTIVVHKEEAGSKVTTSDTWNFSLSGGTTKPDISISNAGTNSFTGLAAGSYTVSELNSGAVSTCVGAGAGAFIATHGTTTNPATPGQAQTSIGVVAGQTTHVYFKNDGCGGTVSIAKSSSPETNVAAGGSATWTITVTVANNPTTAATTITDALPGTFEVAAPGISDGASGGGDSTKMACSPSAAGTTSFSCTLDAGAPAGTYTITVPVTAPANYPFANCQTYTNTAQIVGGAQATDTLTVTGCVNPSVALSKSNDLSGPLASGGTFNWKVTATVSSGPTVANATIVDTLPGGFTFNGAITFTGSQDASKLSCNAPVGQAVTCTLASGAANGDYYIIIPVKAPTVSSSTQCGNYTNEATASFPANQGAVSGSPATNQVTVVCPALTITKTANPVGPVNLGSPIGFDLTVKNTSTVPATGVSVSDTLPNIAGVVWSTATAGCGVAGNLLTCTGLTVAANNGTFVVHVSGSTTGVTTREACGPITNDNATATVIGVTATSGSASVTVNCPSVTIAKVANPTGPVNAGAGIGWTFTVTNTTGIVATNVSVSDTLPVATGVSWSATANTTSGSGSCAVTAGTLSCTGLTVPANGSVTVSVTGTTTGTGADKTCGTITNTGATATLLGTVSNQVASASVVVNCPDPSVAKSGNGPVTAGDNLVFTVTVTAGGTGTQSVSLTDTMPGTGLSWTKGGDNESDCTPAGPLTSGSQYSCTFNNLNPGDTRTVTFTAASNSAMCAAGPLSNTANITSTGDVNDANNHATATITVNCPIVTLTKTADQPTTVSAGDMIGFTVTATNSGSGIAHGFALTDTLPANVTGWTISPANADCAISSGVLHCPAAGVRDLAANGGSISVHVIGTTTPATCGTVSNTASAVVTNQVNAIASVSAQVLVNCPELTVLKTADNGTISAGETAAFTIVVTNSGAGTAKGATLHDVLPAGITWSEDSADCTITSGVMDCTFGEIAPAGTRTIHVTGLTTKENCALQSNTATVAATNEANTANNSSTAAIGVNCADISVLKTADATPVNATDGIGFTITAKNNGTGTAKGVSISDALPTTAGLAWVIDAANSDAGCTITAGTLNCAWGDFAQNASKKVHITSPTTVATCGTIANTAGVGTTNDGSGTSAASVVVNCPNVTVEKTKAAGQADPVSAGGTIAFQIKVTVGGAGTAYNVTASDTLPANTSQWVVTNDPSAATACAVVVNQLTCSFGNVTTPKTFTITVTGKAIGANGGVTCETLTNTATVAAGNEANTSDNSSSATIGVNCPNVGIAKTASNSPINAGDEAEFKITVSNSGQGTATGVVVNDTLPTTGNLSWAIDPAVPGCAIIAGVLTCSGDGFASMAPSTSIDIYVSATTNPAACGVLNNYAYVSAGNDNVEGQTQSNLAMISVNCPDVSVVKTPGAPTINAGDAASFTLKVTNLSPTGSAYGVVLTDELPASAIGWLDDSAVCSIDGAGKLTCTIGTMAPSGVFTVTVSGTTTPAQCGTLPNTALVSATNEPGAADANNSSSASIAVNCPDVTVEKTPDGQGISAGEDAVFTIVVTNIGTGVAYDVKLSDPLPAGLTWSDDSDDCSVNAGTLDCSWATLPASGSHTITLTAVTAPAQCVELPNTASASASNEAESATSNNQDSGSITVACPDVDVVKTAVNSSINPGEDAEFSITISNAGPGNAFGVALTDVLPAGLSWVVDDTDACEISAGTLHCDFKVINAGDSVTVTISAATTTEQCGVLSNTASITVGNEASSLSEDNTSTASLVVACGTIQVIKIDSVAANDPERPTDWDFTITGPNGFNESRSIALGGGSTSITNVPLGAGYAVNEVQAKFGACPVPNETGTYRTTASNGPQSLTGSGQTISFTFTNQECGIVASTGTLVIKKVSDLNGNHVQDPGEAGLSSWPITVTGPEFPSGTPFLTDASGQLVLPGIQTGAYTISEASQTGYEAVGVVTDDNAPAFTAATTTAVVLDYGDTDTVTFFNRPIGSILVNKTTQILLNGVIDPRQEDRDGWRITVSSAACGISTSKSTDAAGNALFSDLPVCSDYVVAEDLSVPGATGYSPLTPASVANVKPAAPAPVRVSFINQKVLNLCTDCNTPATPTPTATATVTPSATSTASPTKAPPTITPTPVSTQAGERTPGPATPTPVAPNTGAGWAGTAVGGSNLLLVMAGLFAVAGGLSFLAMGRKRRQGR